MGQSRLDLKRSIEENIEAMAGPNLQAHEALWTIYEEGPRIDPSAFGDGVAALIYLDELEIYETMIELFFDQVCNQDPVKAIALIRAVQLGILSAELLKRSIWSAVPGRESFDFERLIEQVREKLPTFNPHQARDRDA